MSRLRYNWNDVFEYLCGQCEPLGRKLVFLAGGRHCVNGVTLFRP